MPRWVGVPRRDATRRSSDPGPHRSIRHPWWVDARRTKCAPRSTDARRVAEPMARCAVFGAIRWRLLLCRLHDPDGNAQREAQVRVTQIPAGLLADAVEAVA